MNVLGISAFYHDSAACVVRDGELVAAIEEEKLSRSKHDSRFPRLAVACCLDIAGIAVDRIDVVAFYEQPEKKLARQIWMGMQRGASAELRRAVLSRLDPGLVVRSIREVIGYDGPIDFVDHHEAHAASSFFLSGFDEAAIMTFDGVGEWATSSYGAGDGHRLELFEEVHFPHSLGLLYSEVTGYLGFEVNEGEYKVMGLAPYGTPRYVSEFRKLVECQEGGQYRLNLEYFDFLDLSDARLSRLGQLFGQPRRQPESELEQFHKDVARSLQHVLEEVLLEKARYLGSRVPSKNLCMAGGVALNCVANGRILKDGPFSNLFVQPAAGDAGGALGAALLVHARRTTTRPGHRRLVHACWGPAYSTDRIGALLAACGAAPLDYRDRSAELLEAVVDRLVAGNVVGWFHGRTEFGPRALGARSILADPRAPGMRDRINVLVKMREAFRPFAPAVLEERAAEYFELDHPSPFMLETCQVRRRHDFPAVTHVDGSARVQTVPGGTRFADLLRAFERRTGCPMLLNTSFNVRGEPIVCAPEHAVLCFARSQIDTLVLEDFVIDRGTQPAHWEKAAEHIPIGDRREVSHRVYAML